MGHLLGATALSFTDGFFHGLGHAVAVQDSAAMKVACGTANGLNEASLRP